MPRFWASDTEEKRNGKHTRIKKAKQCMKQSRMACVRGKGGKEEKKMNTLRIPPNPPYLSFQQSSAENNHEIENVILKL